MKDYRKFVFVLIAVALVNLIAMLIVMPDPSVQVPVHFNYNFEVDRMGSAWMLPVFPAITLLFTIGIAVEQKIRGRDYANNKPLTIFACAFVALFIAIGWVMYAMMGSGAQMGEQVEMPLDLIMGLGMSVLFIIMGNYMPVIKPNRTFGIKIPATFKSEEIWRRTHRFAGPVFVAGGAFSAVMALIGHFADLSWLIFVGLMVGIFAPCIIVLIYAHRLAKD